MKTKFYVFVAVAAIAMIGCSKLEEQPAVTGTVPVEFATVLTKTQLAEGNGVVWEANDKISVFDGVDNREFAMKGSPSGSSATFTGEVSDGATEYYAVYPYESGNSLSDTVLTASVPAAQTIVEGSFESGASVAAAHTTDASLTFTNQTALIKFRLGSEMTGVSQVVFSGNSHEKVAGEMKMSWNGSIFTQAPASAAVESVTLSAPSGYSFDAQKDYYLAFIPQNFPAGVKLTFIKGENEFVKSSSKSLSAEAGKIYSLIGETTLAASLAFEEESYTFDYGEEKTLSFTGKNVDFANTTLTLPAGWSCSSFNSNSVTIIAPTEAVVKGNAAGSTTYQPLGAITENLKAESGVSSVVSGPTIRLRGINSSEEFNEFRTAYGNGSASFSAGSSYGRRVNDCIDYLVNEEITLNDDISATQESAFPFYILHHIEHNLNGNGKTFTMTVADSAWPIGFCQTIFGTVKVYDLKLAGTINWTYSAAATTGGCCGGFVAQSNTANTESLTFENVENSVNITWTSESTADPTKHHAVGGFVGAWTDKPVTIVNCSYSGKITKNCRNLAVGGFVAWNAGASVAKFDNCTFSGEINDTATSSKTAWTTGTNLEFIGGFVGATDGNANALLEFKGCESAGTIKVSNGARELGGFVGKASCPVTFADNDDAVHCRFNGNIDYTETEAVSTLAEKIVGDVGGYVGYKTANTISFSNCTFASGGMITVKDGAFVTGGYVGVTDVDVAFTGCSFGGTIDFTTYPSAAKNATSAGRVGGFVGQIGAGTTVCSLTDCQVLSIGLIETKVGVTASGGFVGNGGAAKATVKCSNCQFHGTLKHNATSDKGQRRIGGIVGDGSRIVELTDCTVDGTLELHTDGTNIVQNFGGVVGNTTKQVDGNTMLTKLNGCVFSGQLKVFNVSASEQAQTNRYGTLIGRNAAITAGDGYGLYIDGSTATTAETSINYGTTSVSFLTE